MTSRFYFKFCFIAICAFQLSACSDFLKGKPKKQDSIEIQADEITCFKTISGQFKKIISSEANETEIESTFDCLNQTLNHFQNKVEGKQNPDSFTTDELFTIFDKFYKNAQLSKEATQDILILKKALLGGSDAVVTKMELGKLKDMLILVKSEVKKLNPYLSIYKFETTQQKYTTQQIDTAFEQLGVSLKTLLQASKLGKSEYEFEDFKKLLSQLNFLEKNQKDLVDLAEKAKNLFVGVDPLKNEKEYELAIDNFVEAMKLYSYVIHKQVVFEISNKDQLDRVYNVAERLLRLVETSVQFQKTGRIKIEHLDLIVEEILKKGKEILPFEVRPETFKTFYKTLIIRVFSDNKALTISSFDEIRAEHINAIKKEMVLFRLYQNFISSVPLSAEQPRAKIADVQSRIKLYNVASENKELLSKFDSNDRKFIVDGFDVLKSEFLSARPIVYRFKKMVVTLNQEIWDQSWEDLTRAHYGKMLARELLRGWGDGQTISEKGFVNWYSDFKDFAVEIKLFDKRSDSVKTGKETFLQANLFTFDGNGDAQLSPSEAMQYVNMLVSGGSQIFNEFKAGLQKAGCNLTELDAFDTPWNDEKCFYNEFKKNYRYYFSNLSYFVVHLDSYKSDDEFKIYYDLLMTVARRDSKTVGKIESADLRTFVMTLMYIESLYAVYDTNKNLFFSPAEIRAAYPRFTSFVTDYAQKNAKQELDEWDTIINPCRIKYPLKDFIKEAFIFMVYNGRLPKKADVNDPAQNIVSCGRYALGLGSDYEPFNFKGEVNRKTIINTFKVLKTALDSK